MGHHGHLKSEHQDLVQRLEASQVGMPEPKDARAWAGYKEILEILYTPEEAALVAKLPVRPASLNSISRRLNIDPVELKKKLDPMCDKGLVMDLVHPETGKVKYFLSPPIVGFFEYTFMRAEDMFPKKRLAEAMDAYMHGDPVFAAEVFGGDTVIGRAMVREEHISEPLQSDVLDWERATQIVEEAKQIGLTLCYCRHKAEHLGKRCDTPMELCLSLDAGADFLIRRGFSRKIDRVEAMDVLQTAKDKKLVQIADNVQDKPNYICNCCPCCCGQLRSINDHDLHGVNPSGFQPEFDHDSCNGCSKCARGCPIGAIQMDGVRVDGKRNTDLRPSVDVDRCIGCGVCAASCTKSAMEMVRRDKQPDVPNTGVERILRMSLERGRLPHLLFDAGSSQGSHFMNKALRVLQKMPVADRVLASKQLQSRFIRQALKMVKSPTG